VGGSVHGLGWANAIEPCIRIMKSKSILVIGLLAKLRLQECIKNRFTF